MEAVFLLIPLMFAMYILVYIFAIAGGAIFGFIEMLALGVLHHNVSSHIPALGFFSCWILAIALTLLFILLTGGVKPTMNQNK